MRATRLRRNDGQAIKDAMKQQNLSLPRLAERTREVDPDGDGVSFQLIGFLIATGSSARESTSPRAAALIAKALGRPEETLFDSSFIGAPADSAQRGTQTPAV